MSGTERAEYSVLEKIQVTCRTCGVSESFYSNLSVKQFKLSHVGHDIAGEEEPETPPEVQSLEPVSTVNESLEMEKDVRIAKVVVDLLVFPALRNPVFRVRGFDASLEEVFVATSPFEQGAKVRGVLARGEYHDQDVSGRRYCWEADVIEYDEGVREKLGIPEGNARTAMPVSPGPVSSESESTVGRTNEVMLGAPGELESVKNSDGPPSDSLSVPPAPLEGVDTPTQPAPAVSTEARDSENERTEAPAQRPPVSARPQEMKEVANALGKAEARFEIESADDYLLVSKSWYIQGGTGNRKEAIRISKVLREFRWKVEPLYTIGVILDDLLSVETSRNQISRTLIRRIEEAGYRLTAVAAEQGKPVAWFKKAEPETPSPPGDARSEEALSRLSRQPDEEGAGESAASEVDEIKAELEQDVVG